MSNKIVVPGDLLTDSPSHMEHTIVEGNKTFASVLGIYDEDKKILVPLEGLWSPRRDDVVLGIVEDARLNSYSINLNSPYKGIIVAKFMDIKIDVGDVVEATVKELDKTGTAVLMRSRKLFGGKLMTVKPSKVPRIIGKSETMLNELRLGTKATIVVGRNGLIWIKGGDVTLATEAILRIVEEAHIPGLTVRIKEMLQQKNR